MNDLIKDTLLEFGVNHGYAGFRHLVDAISITVDKLEQDQDITLGVLYETVAERSDQPIWNIERRIRVSIDQTFENPNESLLELLGPYINVMSEPVRTLYFIKAIATKCIVEGRTTEE